MSDLPLREVEFAVIGGGLVGMAIAWGLVSRGRKVVVLDGSDLDFRASRGNFALVWVQSKGAGMPEYGCWTMQSSQLWPHLASALAEQTGLDVCFSRPGGLHLLLSDREMQNRTNALQRLHDQPGMEALEYEMLDRDQVAKMQPQIGPEVAGASFCPQDGHVNALRLLRAFHVAFAHLGGEYCSNCLVQRIEPNGGEFRLSTANGVFTAAKIVLAAGLGNSRLASLVGLSAPVRPQRGQIIVTEKVAPFMNYVVHTVRQTDEGGVMISDSVEEADFDASVSTEVLSTMAGRAVRMFPLLAQLNVVRCWAALRVMPQDGFPIYDQSQSCPGAFIATCHSGVTLAANHALVLPPLIDAGTLPAKDFQAFSTKRFNVPAAH
jgi:glycine/D-amino acid oxidase-like deaminating enzyme